MKMSHIKFEDMSHTYGIRKTKVFHVISSFDGTALGVIQWFSHWRQYVFEPNESIKLVFSHDCLLEIYDFVKQLMDDRKKAIK